MNANCTRVDSVPELRGRHTEGKSLDLLKWGREVVGLCLEAESAPIDSQEFIEVQRILG